MITSTTLDFLSNLKANNIKAWFDEHREEYQKAQGDFLDTVVQLLTLLTSFDVDIAASYLDPKSCIMRINRDIRFSKDKTPYKTNFFAFINKGGRKSPYAGYYLHIEPGATFIGGGIYIPETAVLDQIRREIDGSFREWESIVQSKELLLSFPESVKASGTLVRPPKGYESTNPAIEYLKFKGYYTQRFLGDQEVTDPGFALSLADKFRSVKPLIDFINRAL
jgi:uncharacterized protein (TIGR02453 family)